MNQQQHYLIDNNYDNDNELQEQEYYTNLSQQQKQNHDLPLSGVAQTLQNFLNSSNNTYMNNSISQQYQQEQNSSPSHQQYLNQNTANFNSVAQFTYLNNDGNYNENIGNNELYNLSEQQQMFIEHQKQLSLDNNQDLNMNINNNGIELANRGRQKNNNSQLPPRSHSQNYGGSFGFKLQQQQIATDNLYTNNNKQVRFNIKDGLKNLIEDSNLEIESIASRSHSLSKVQQNNNSKSFVNQKEKQTKSPKNIKNVKNELPKNNKKTASIKSRQLALKYKREADQSRRRKQGEDGSVIDDISSIPPDQYDDISQLNNNQSYTEKFINIQVNEKSPEKIIRQIPTPSIQPQLQVMNDILIPRQMQQQQQRQSQIKINNDQQENVKQNPIMQQNQQQQIKATQIQPAQVGTIMKRENLSQTRETQIQSNLIQTQQQQQQKLQPGTIMRKRSVSPAIDSIIQIGINKENQSLNINMNNSSNNVLAGQIVKLQNQKMNQTYQFIPQQEVVMSPKIIQSERQPNRIVQQSQIFEQQQQPFIHSFRQEMEIQQHQKPQQQKQPLIILYKYIWDCFKQEVIEVEKRFHNSQQSLNQLRYQLLTQLTQTPRYYNLQSNYIESLSKQKLQTLRQSLSQLYQEKFLNDIMQIMKLRDQKQYKQQQLKITLKQINHNNQQLKIELIRDILSRLTQKIVIKVMQLNLKIKNEISLQFSAYYQEYISRDYVKAGFEIMKQYKSKRQEKNSQLYIARDLVRQVKAQQVFKAWKYIKEYKKNNQLWKQETKSILLSRKVVRLLTHWKITIITQRNMQLGYVIAQERQKLKFYEELFIKWIYQHRTSNKIKRKVLMMMSPNAHKRFKQNNSDTLNDEEWLQSQIQKLKSKFNNRIQEYLLEREHNKTFIDGLQFKVKASELNDIFPLKSQHKVGQQKKQDFTGARRSNEIKIYQSIPELRYKSKSPIRNQRNLVNQTINNLSSANLKQHLSEPLILKQQNINVRKSQELDIDLKYSIHSALVYHQNTKQLQQSQVDIHSHSLIQDKQQLSAHKTKNKKNFVPPPPKRLIELEQIQHSQQIDQNYAPNQIFRKLQDQLNLQQTPKQRRNSQDLHHYSDNLMPIPLDIQLREHIKTLKFKINSLEQLSYNHHFKQSLKVNATNILQQDQEEFTGLTDYIQYGISCDQYRMVFISMFKTKVLSKLLNKWKIEYLKRQLYQDLDSLHIIKYSHQSFIEWNRVIKSKKLKIKEYERTKQVQKYYKLFLKWVQWNRLNVRKEANIIREFQKRTIFKNWIKYLDSQGQNLMKILRSQQYYKQALLSKSLLSLYKNYLKQLRVKRFQRKIYFKKYFQQKWYKQFLKRALLKKILNKINDRVLLNERLKYQREFETKKEVVLIWKDRVNEKVKLIKQYTALTHYKQTLICKSFIGFKKNQNHSKASRILVQIILNSLIQPAFEILRDKTVSQKKTEINFLNYRQNYQKAQVFNILRQNTVENRLQKLFVKKKVFQGWKRINFMKNHQLPLQYRQQRMYQIFFYTMKSILKEKWAQERSVIIERNLLQQKSLKLKKIVFVKLLENILMEKRSRIIDQTVREFRDHNLIQKCFKMLKKQWSIKNTEQIMNKVANDFHAKIMKRRQLKKRQYYESKGIFYSDEETMTKNRIFNAWRLHTEHKLTKNLVLVRFLEFKRRFQTLRTFLAWRSMAKYEHTPSHHKSRQSTQGKISEMGTGHFNHNFRPIDTSHRTSHSPSSSHKYPNLPFSVQSPQISQYNHLPNQNGGRMTNNQSQKNLPQAIYKDNSLTQLHNRDNTYNTQRYQSQNAQQQPFGNYPQSVKNQQISSHIIGSQDLTQIKPQIDETPFKLNEQAQDKSLFDELENIFQKNKKWLDEQKEREDFLREMAQHYNQRLSQEMNSLKYNTLTQSDKYRSITSNYK